MVFLHWGTSFLSKVRNLKKLSIDYSNNGYARVSLSIDKKSLRFYVHRLVGYAFLGLDLTDKTLQINHKDGIKSNNTVDNLEILTSSANHIHAYKVLGRKSSVPKGASSKLSYTYKITHPSGEIEEIKGLKEFCRKFRLSVIKLSEISRGLRKQHKGFKAERITS